MQGAIQPVRASAVKSGPRHWQTNYEQKEPSFRRVQQKDWEAPQPSDWKALCVDQDKRQQSLFI
jgi:predicted alpha/beta hydrolase family esterase